MTSSTNGVNEHALKPYRSPWPRVIIGVFILLAIWNGLVLYLASTSRVSLIDQQPYEAGLTYENVITESLAAKKLGIKAEFKAQSGELIASLTSLPTGREWQAELELIRPNDAALDQKLIVRSPGPLFHFPSRELAKGLWLVRLRVTSGELKYHFEDKVIF